MANKQNLNPSSIQTNTLIAEIPEKRLKIAQAKFRHDLLEAQKRVNYQNEFDRLQGAKKLPGLDPHVKNRMEELQSMAPASLKGEPYHRIYSSKF